MTMISFAGDQEDVLLARVFRDKVDGFYVDVGANDPVTCSVTKHFYDHGWHGINIEPIPRLHDRLRAARPRDVNLNVGLADRGGQLTFHECPAIDAWSTFSREVADHHRSRGVEVQEYPVPVTTLAEICAQHVRGEIDFLKIDVEGLEREVIAGGD